MYMPLVILLPKYSIVSVPLYKTNLLYQNILLIPHLPGLDFTCQVAYQPVFFFPGCIVSPLGFLLLQGWSLYDLSLTFFIFMN
jgi:hypothetical protein